MFAATSSPTIPIPLPLHDKNNTRKMWQEGGENMRYAIINEQRATQFAYCPRSQSNHMNRKLKRKSLVCKYTYNAKYSLPRTEAYSLSWPGPDLKLSNIHFILFRYLSVQIDWNLGSFIQSVVDQCVHTCERERVHNVKRCKILMDRGLK